MGFKYDQYSIPKTIFWSFVAAVITLFIWSYVIFFDITPEPIFFGFVMKLHLNAPMLDALISFLLPVAAIALTGTAKKWNRTFNADFAAFWFFGATAGLGIVVSSIIGVVVAVIVVSVHVISKNPDTLLEAKATAIGFLASFLFFYGLTNGWLFPYAIIIAHLVRNFGVEWYWKGMEGIEMPAILKP